MWFKCASFDFVPMKMCTLRLCKHKPFVVIRANHMPTPPSSPFVAVCKLHVNVKIKGNKIYTESAKPSLSTKKMWPLLTQKQLIDYCDGIEYSIIDKKRKINENARQVGVLNFCPTTTRMGISKSISYLFRWCNIDKINCKNEWK